jgi:chaperonin cofactor prefoldin
MSKNSIKLVEIKMEKTFFMFILLCSIISVYGKPVEFTQEDRDRIIRLEEGQKPIQVQIARLEEGQKSLEKQIENTNKRIDDLKETIQRQIDDLRTLILWVLGVTLGGIGILIGFVIWDRRTAVEPVAKKNEELEKRVKELEEKEGKLEMKLREYAKSEPRLADILK